ncbi:MAG: LLM class flavin-dependent oxidoreductase, partial [Myxococcales bacterium]|nr:LLM class flavin-dependent oxidoreductase [Myxococcales bacterium]
MRIGIFVSETWGGGSDVAEVRARAQRAEALGFASAWVPYLPWSLDALASIQAAGDATRAIALGTAVIPTYLFHPLALARQAATVQAAIGRPIELGIGCSNEAVIAMHGLAYERPAQHVREYLGVLDAALRAGAAPTGEREHAGLVQFEGELFRVGSIYGTPGASPLGSVLVGALGPLM